MTPLAQSLALSPEVYPHTLDQVNDAVLFIRLTEANFARASFLDQRALAPGTKGDGVRWDAVQAAVDEAGLDEDLGFVFHSGHVGSTLLSRLIGGHPSVLSLREPLPFRVLAQAQVDVDSPESPWSPADLEARLSAFLKLWSRRFREGQLPVVKATSFCSELAAPILSRASRPRAVLMAVAPEPYLATIFAGQNNHLDIRGMATNRLRRLHERIGSPAWRLHELSYGEQVAMTWAAETAALADAAAAAGERALWLDFERLLAEPEPALAEVFAHFGREVSAAEVDALAAGPEMRRYAKAPEHGYDAALRRTVLDQARQEHAGEMRKGLAWLEQAAAAHPVIARALEARG